MTHEMTKDSMTLTRKEPLEFLGWRLTADNWAFCNVTVTLYVLRGASDGANLPGKLTVTFELFF